MTTDNLPHEADGIQLTLQSFISNSISDTTFNKILYTLWYIWKARNDYHFNRKQWTPAQVHHAAAGHMSSYNAALTPQVMPHNNSTEDPSSHMDTNRSQMPLSHDQTPHQGINRSMQMQHNRYQVTAPALLQGHRCYVDASTTPDLPNQLLRRAGLGIFFLLMQEQSTEAIYIRQSSRPAPRFSWPKQPH